jgi:hypothetical protein
MLERFKQTVNTILINFKRLVTNNKFYFIIFFFSLFFLVLFLSLFNISSSLVNNFLLPDGDNFRNFEKLFFSGNIFYLINILIEFKFEFVAFFYNCLKIFLGFSTFNFDELLFKISVFFKYYGEKNLLIYYNDLASTFLFNYEVFKFHY